jgi:aryl-alcohol dehydrogenase-like predicted oxidoreductase
MKYRTFGRLGWQVNEVGYGMWGLAGWTGGTEQERQAALRLAVEGGCNFFDTALAYGEGASERVLGQLVQEHHNRHLYTATKIPPKDGRWPSRRGSALADVFPPEHIRSCVDTSLANLGLPSLDLIQFHVWEDEWAEDPRWQRAVDDLKRQGLVRGVGVSVNRWEPWNVLRTLGTGLIDAVQVIYNIFDQVPEDELFPACKERAVAVIARVPFDEGSLTGTLTRDSRWPTGDWRNSYFVAENLNASVERVEQLRPLVPAGSTMPEMALRFILSNPDVATVIPGMRRPASVRSNLLASDAGPLPADLLAGLRQHRWGRKPTAWSQ